MAKKRINMVKYGRTNKKEVKEDFFLSFIDDTFFSSLSYGRVDVKEDFFSLFIDDTFFHIFCIKRVEQTALPAQQLFYYCNCACDSFSASSSAFLTSFWPNSASLTALNKGSETGPQFATAGEY